MARTRVLLSNEVLAAIDAVAGKRGRSRFLEEAATLALAETVRATAGVARGSAYSHWRNRAETSAWVRKTRRTESRD